MCYTGRCSHENYFGECTYTGPHSRPCPVEDEVEDVDYHSYIWNEETGEFEEDTPAKQEEEDATD